MTLLVYVNVHNIFLLKSRPLTNTLDRTMGERVFVPRATNDQVKSRCYADFIVCSVSDYLADS